MAKIDQVSPRPTGLKMTKITFIARIWWFSFDLKVRSFWQFLVKISLSLFLLFYLLAEVMLLFVSFKNTGYLWFIVECINALYLYIFSYPTYCQKYGLFMIFSKDKKCRLFINYLFLSKMCCVFEVYFSLSLLRVYWLGRGCPHLAP